MIQTKRKRRRRKKKPLRRKRYEYTSRTLIESSVTIFMP